MVVHQLDLFGGPLKPPKKITVDDDIPEETTQPVMETTTDGNANAPELVADVTVTETDSNTEELEPSYGAEWISEEEEEIAAEPEVLTGSHEEHLDTESAIHVEQPNQTSSVPEADIINIDGDDINFTDDAIFIEELIDQPVDVEEPIEETNDTSAVAAAETENIAAETATTRGRKQIQETEYDADGLSIPPDEELFKRQYYSMRETSAMFGVNQSLLRFWENEFDILQPKKNKKGDRYFRPVDIKNLVLIYHLLRVRKFTLDGAKDYLQSHKNAGNTFELIRRLEKLKSFLLELKAGL